MGEGRKAFEESLGLEGLHVERERKEKGEQNEKWKISCKWAMLTNEDQASLNSQKENIKQYQSGHKALFGFWLTVVNSNPVHE